MPNTVTVAKRQAERSEATRSALIDAARKLFAAQGFAATPIEEIVARAGVTRGALYHHFRDKEELFRAVVEAVQESLMEGVSRAARGGDPWQRLLAGCRAFLGACLEPEIQQVALRDAPAVLGWRRWREVDAKFGLALLRRGLEAAVAEGQIRAGPIDPLAHLLLGALGEGALLIAHAADPRSVQRSVIRQMEELLAGLRAGQGRRTAARRSRALRDRGH